MGIYDGSLIVRVSSSEGKGGGSFSLAETLDMV